MYLSPSLEDYLETVYIFEKKNGFSRVKEIADFLSVKLPSVNKAIKELEKRNLLTHQRYGYIKLTEDGLKLAIEIFLTHQLLIDFFKLLGFDDKKSLKYGCYLEHIIENEDKEKISKIVKILKEKKLWN